ncbi:general secretion pathway protein C [Ramlibacter sp. MAH-25]|uniref:General secretion pathway protein C n=1 Tax=Ramlibacter pinisoli TaxID=2682844 RepID=A0A6N8ITX6_9BURK|nr:MULTISPECIES: type II secretion system protein N [Ramlibacter]MBA2965380.1 general secretion pathway protein C [Ramlibacter sp. CGMCC 1.13660]MVQ30344.1 general secretion pathway protein C [Ramlibacter pinisoli]
MVSNRAGSWTLRGVTFLLWALAAASIAYWGLKLGSSPAVGAGPVAGVRGPAPVDPAAVGRLLGQVAPGPTTAGPAPAAPAVSSRFNLIGVVAARSHQGAALIAVDGRPAKPYRVGSAIDEGLVLKSVEPRRAVLAASSDGPAVVTLELPKAPQAQ